MSARWHSLSDARLALAAMLAILAPARPAAHAQAANGSLAVSATILPPAASQATRLTAFSVARDGIATLEVTGPAGSGSRIVMWSVWSSANGSVSVEHAPTRIETLAQQEVPTPLRGVRTTRLRFGVDVGATNRSPVDTCSRTVTVRMHSLIVPGT